MSHVTITPRRLPASLCLATIGNRLAENRDRIDEFGEIVGPEHSEVIGGLFDEQRSLIRLALALRPATLQDAGVLAMCVSEQVNTLATFNLPREEAEPILGRLVVAMAGILLALRQAGIPLDAGPINADEEIERHFPAAGAAMAPAAMPS